MRILAASIVCLFIPGALHAQATYQPLLNDNIVILRNSGSGTVTVVGAGSLTSGKCVTGGGSQTIQTPSSNCAVDSGGNVTATSVATGTTPPAVTPGTAGLFACVEGTAPTGVAASDILWCDSTGHRFKVINNNGSAGTLVDVTGSITSGHAAVFSGTGGTIIDGGAAGGSAPPYWAPFIGSQVSASCSAAAVLISNGVSPTCPADTSTAPYQGYGLWFEDAGTHNFVIVSVPIPPTYAGTNVAVSLYFAEHSGHHTYQFAVETLSTNIDGTAFGSFNAAQNFTSTTTTGTGMNVVTISNVTKTGFTASGELLLRFSMANNPNAFVHAIAASVLF